MSNHIRAIVKAHNRDIAREKEITLRKHLNADALFTSVNDHLIEPPMIGLIEPLSGGHFWLSDVVNF